MLSATARRTRSQTVALDCFVGKNWVLTAHASELAAMEDFRERAEGAGEIGILDAPSFLAELLNWVVTSYLRAFDKIEVELEEFDIRVLRSTRHDVERQISALVEVRRRVGELRRSLAPHREVFVVLSTAEFDPVSTEESAKRFGELTAKIETALAAARDAKDAVVGSFDVLIARTEHRTNEIIKVLTLASILLLPGALIAGVMGMNFKAGLFEHAALFWVVNGVIVLIALVTFGRCTESTLDLASPVLGRGARGTSTRNASGLREREIFVGWLGGTRRSPKSAQRGGGPSKRGRARARRCACV